MHSFYVFGNVLVTTIKIIDNERQRKTNEKIVEDAVNSRLCENMIDKDKDRQKNHLPVRDVEAAGSNPVTPTHRQSPKPCDQGFGGFFRFFHKSQIILEKWFMYELGTNYGFEIRFLLTTRSQGHRMMAFLLLLNICQKVLQKR